MYERFSTFMLGTLVFTTACFDPTPDLPSGMETSSTGGSPMDGSSATEAGDVAEDGATASESGSGTDDEAASTGSASSDSTDDGTSESTAGESSSESSGTPDDPSETGPDGSYVVLFDGGVEILGDWGPRLAADTHCDSHPDKPEGMQAVAFASFSAESEIQDLPQLGFEPTVEVRGPSGTISTSWAALLDGNIEASLSRAGVLPADAYWLSGSNPNGTIDTFGACSGFTNTEQNANAGYSDANNDAWMHHHGGGCWESTTHYHRLCLAF